MNIKNRPLKFARFHAGVAVGAKVINSATPGKDNVVALELLDIGVYIFTKDHKGEYHDVVPFGNILTVRLGDEELPASSKKDSK